jgi:very-short-patch-repair endonuclease
MDQEVLVALLKEKSDFAILREQGWYRIPVGHEPKRWPPQYLAFYQPKDFGADAFRIRYYGRVSKIKKVLHRTLFPSRQRGEKSNKLYYRIDIEKLEKLPRPIPSRFPRPIVFIPTTWKKFHNAEQLNDLFDESPLEDEMWKSLKSSKIFAERQWPERVGDNFYQLDFAVFCNKGKIDIEADGDTWHAQRERIDKDNNRNNGLEEKGWKVLRYNGKQIREEQPYYLAEIQKTINRLDGLIDDGLVPRKFYPDSDGAQQLSLFEGQAEYDVDLD